MKSGTGSLLTIAIWRRIGTPSYPESASNPPRVHATDSKAGSGCVGGHRPRDLLPIADSVAAASPIGS
jgi:hypothetical protein